MSGRASGSVVLALLLGACAGGTGAFGHRDPNPSGQLYVPSQVSGGNRGGGRDPGPSAEHEQAANETEAARLAQKAANEKVAEEQQAENLWTQAQAACSPSTKAKLYGKIADDHKDSPHAEEARWLQAYNAYQAGDWTDTISDLDTYMKAYPINAHLPEVEQILYQSCLNAFEAARGLKGIFKSDKKAYEGLNALVERFPEGAYADDALLALGDVHRRKDDLPEACLAYRNLLLRYPDSEWSFVARLRLADTYLARDQGPEYNAGYVDLDPRGPTTPQYAATRPIKPCVEAAMQNYQSFLDRIAEDPARGAEYADRVAYAQGQVENCRQRMAAKDRAIGGYYGRSGRGDCALVYGKFAENVVAGKSWCDAVPPAPSVVPSGKQPSEPGAPPSLPPIAPPVVPPQAGPPPVPPPPVAPPVAPPPVTPPTYVPPPPPRPTSPTTVPPAPLPAPRHVPSTATIVR